MLILFTVLLINFNFKLQHALVAVAKKHIQVAMLFFTIASVITVVGASSKRRDILHQIKARIISEALNSGELSSGRGLNQETTLKRAVDSR